MFAIVQSLSVIREWASESASDHTDTISTTMSIQLSNWTSWYNFSTANRNRLVSCAGKTASKYACDISVYLWSTVIRSHHDYFQYYFAIWFHETRAHITLITKVLVLQLLPLLLLCQYLWYVSRRQNLRATIPIQLSNWTSWCNFSAANRNRLVSCAGKTCLKYACDISVYL